MSSSFPEIDLNKPIKQDDSLIYSASSFFKKENYEFITKEYSLRIKSRDVLSKKIRYNNPDDYNKTLKVYSNDPFIFIKSPDLVIEFKTSRYIKFDIRAPITEGIFTGYIFVVNLNDVHHNKMEEVLKFIIEVY